MKKLALILTFLGVLFLASCEDDCDCPSGPSESSIAMVE